MQAIELETEIDESRELHLTLPESLRAGKVRVIVLQEESRPKPIAAPTDPDAFFEQLESFAVTPRSRQAIDEALEHEREDWY